jgi:hypothetical protein
MRSLLAMGIPYQHAPEVSIVSTPDAGRLEGAIDRPEFEAKSLKTVPVANHCTTATYRSVAWKTLARVKKETTLPS